MSIEKERLYVESLSWFISYIYSSYLEIVQDFLCQLDMKPLDHLSKINMSSLYQVIVRLTTIMNNLVKHLKIMIFKVIF